MRAVRAALMFAWPFLASVALIALIVASVVTVGTTLAQRDALVRQAEQVEDLLLAQQAEDANRAERLAAALAEVDRITQLRYEQQAERTQARYDELVAKIEALLARPEGSQPDPVIAVPRG